MDLTALTEEELDQLQLDIRMEMQRRSDLASIPDTVDLLNRNFLAASGVQQGEEWRQPTGAHDAYPVRWTVTHGGITWESLVSANVWEPGVTNWREVSEPEAPPAEWRQPLGSTDAYNKGDRVTFQGEVYESVIDANVWSPSGYPQGWKLVPAS